MVDFAVAGMAFFGEFVFSFGASESVVGDSGVGFTLGIVGVCTARLTTGAGRTELRGEEVEGRLATSITGRDEFDCII